MSAPDRARHSFRLFDRRVPLPRWKWLRVTLGVIFVLGGSLGFLPVLGFWMVPVGFLILSVDFASVRRLRRRLEVTLIPKWRRLVARWRAWRAGDQPQE